MDIKTLLGDAYKEGMTLDEINAALADKNFVDPSSLPKSVDKATFDKTASELAKVKKELGELKDSSLTADEKLQAALEAAKTKETEYAQKSNRLEVEKLFVNNGLTEADYKDVIEDIVSSDLDKSVKLATNLVNMVTAQKSSTEKALRAELLKGTPKPPAGDGSPATSPLDKQIAEAQEKGDMARVAALLRQQAEEQTKT